MTRSPPAQRSGSDAGAALGPARGLVVRPRLYDRLERAVKGPVTLISGPAGSGKTQLVASWLRHAKLPGPVAWFSVDRDEGDAMRFWDGVIEALHGSGAVETTARLRALTPAPRTVPGEFVRRLAERLGELTAPVLLVVDDFHHLRSEDARDGVAALLAQCPSSLRVMLITRRDPVLGLHRLRVAGQLTEVRGPDLQFTVEEAGELIARAGIALRDDGVARLHQRTEGWAAGLRLAALALVRQQDPDRFVAEFSGSERTVADYLMGEVLASQPPAARRLLLRTSVLDRVNGPLANLLAGVPDGQRILQDLADANAFVEPVDAGRSWFRYHRLLADFLRAELECEAPEEVAELHRAAARWHAEQGLCVEAIRHAEAGADWEFAADQLMEHWFSLFLDGRRVTLHGLVAAIPVEVLRSNAELATLVATDRLGQGRMDDADAYLALAKRLADSVPATRRQRFDVVLAVVDLLLVRTRGDFDAAIDHAHAILTPAEGEGDLAKVVANDDVRALALMNLGIVELWARRAEEAERHLQEAHALARRIGRPYIELNCIGSLAQVAQMAERLELSKARAREATQMAENLACSDGPVAGVAYSALGSALMVEGRLSEAESWLLRARRAMHGVYDLEPAIVVRFRLGMVHFGQGRYEEALGCFCDAERAHRGMRAPHYLTVLVQTWQLRSRMRLGDTQAARRALTHAGAEASRLIEWRTLAANLYLAENRPRAAVDALAPVLDGSVRASYFAEEVEALLLDAVARERLGQADAVEMRVERALDLAEPHGWYAMALGVPMASPMLATHPRDRTAHAAFLDEVVVRLGGAVPQPAAGELPARLSERELDVVRFLPTNLSAAEIGSELLLSVHTVKTHMRSIYAKLDVHRRTDAVNRARGLGLLAAGHTNRAMPD